MNMDIFKVCRICMKAAISLADVEVTRVICNGQHYFISEIINSFLEKSNPAFGEVPFKVCSSCKANATQAYNFKLQCNNSQKLLSIMLSKFNFTENVIDNLEPQDDCQKLEIVDVDDDLAAWEHLQKQDFKINPIDIAQLTGEVHNFVGQDVYENQREINGEHLSTTAAISPNETMVLNTCNNSTINISTKEKEDFRINPIDIAKLTGEVHNLVRQNVSENQRKINDEHLSTTAAIFHNETKIFNTCNDSTLNISTKDRLLESRVKVAGINYKSYLNSHNRKAMRAMAMSNIASKKCSLHSNFTPIVKAYLCGICGKKFQSPAKLDIHMKLHASDLKELPYKCDFCRQAFQHHCNLMKHRKIHTGITATSRNFYPALSSTQSMQTQQREKSHVRVLRTYSSKNIAENQHKPKQYQC